MNYQYSELSIQAFREQPATVEIDGRVVNYLSFCLPENREKTPIVLIGGAFQHFHSFFKDVKAYLPYFPVILVALPGQCSNHDNHDNSELSLRDLAALLDGLFENLGLESITMAGFSYGSLLAYTYAYYYEARLEHLILVGCSLNLRHTQRQMLAYAVDHYGPDNLEEFSEAIAQGLFNLNARNETGLSMDLVERLSYSIRNFSDKEISDYHQNSLRLLREKICQRSFSVRALIVTAQYDHFIMPHESLDVHSLFSQGDFVMVERGDHLVPLQSPRLIFQTVLDFLQGQEYCTLGILHGNPAMKLARERRKQPRHKVTGLSVCISNADGFIFEGKLEDISVDGCGVTLPKAMGVSADFSGAWKLDIGASGLEIPGFLRVNHGKASFVFLKQSFSAWEIMTDFVNTLHETTDKPFAI